MKLEIVCLANSRKMSGRCVAGLRTDGGGWVRPVAPTKHGELHPEHYTLREGGEPRLLDVLAVRVREHRPEPHQPENWLIANKAWRRVVRASPSDFASLLSSHLHDGTPLFGTSTDRVTFSAMEETPSEYSLALIAPDRVDWSVAPNFYNRPQARAQFEWGDVTYDLVVTDPNIEARLLPLGYGAYSSEEAGLEGERFYLTVSLGEAMESGYCFKLVAAVIPSSLATQ